MRREALAESAREDRRPCLVRIKGAAEISAYPWFREATSINEQNGQSYRSFELTRQGFTLLVLGRTVQRVHDAEPAPAGVWRPEKDAEDASRLAISDGPMPCAFNARTWSASIDAGRPL